MANSGLLAGVGNFTGFALDTNEIVVNAKTVTETTLNPSIEAAEARGGQGNMLLGKYFHTSALKLTITDVIWNLNYLALNLGGSITASADIMTNEQFTVTTANTITVTQTPQAFTNTTGTIGWYKVAGADDTTYQMITFTGNSAIVTGLTVGTVVCVKYIIKHATAREFIINADYVPSIIHGYLSIGIFASSTTSAASLSTSSKIGEVQVNIPRFQLDGTQTLSLTSTSIANISLSGSALAVFDGSSCNSNGYYAVFKEIFYNTNVFDNVTSLAVVGGNIELATGGTSTLKIMGVKNDGTTTVIDNSNFTFTATGSSATVSTAGVITASSTGTTTIEVVATSQTSLTTACVVTVS